VRNRPTARVVHAALGAPGGPPTITFNVREDQWGGMLSSVGEGLAAPGAARSTRAVEVPYTTMDALLEGHQGEIDVAVIDVEGHEVPLLQGFDLRRWRPKMLIIEGFEGDTPLTRYMSAFPYGRVRQAHNYVYIRDDLMP
jgi:FkbM family methyltransferase